MIAGSDATGSEVSRLATSDRRADSLTGSPITVYSSRCSEPMWPAMALPAETPMPMSVSPSVSYNSWRISRAAASA